MEANNFKRRALIIDLDNTLCNAAHRSHVYFKKPVNWDLLNRLSVYDPPNEWCLEIIRNFAANNYKIIFLTGRSEAAKEVTEQWLMQYVGPGIDYEIFMRAKNDRRPDTTTKSETYFKEIAPKYEVMFVIDDRREVTQMWRNLGITCLACADNI